MRDDPDIVDPEGVQHAVEHQAGARHVLAAGRQPVGAAVSRQINGDHLEEVCEEAKRSR
jgi:hypothetical protein